MIGLVLLSAPVGYALLTGYLFLKVQPFPITILPNALLESEDSSRPQGLAA